MSKTKSVDETIREIEDLIHGRAPPRNPPREDPLQGPLFGGVAGVRISQPSYELTPGLAIRPTFAHIFAPYMMAFAPPEKPRAPHPGPWRAAHGGLGMDIHVEIALAKGVRPTGLDRLNTLWWVVALLRLRTGAPARIPVVSDTPFASAATSTAEPNLMTIEMAPLQRMTSAVAKSLLDEPDLAWLRGNLVPAAPLLDTPHFNRAFQTFDSAVWAHSAGSAIIMVWAALEALFRPGRQAITKTLAILIATFLHPAGPNRDREFRNISVLYGARGTAAHDAAMPEADELMASFALGRRVFEACIERRELPDASALLKNWRERI